MNTPIIWNPQSQTLDDFKKQHPVDKILDKYDELLEEVFLIRNPKYKMDKNYGEPLERFAAEQLAAADREKSGVWWYFPWNKLLAHYLPDAMHQEVRTARNKNIITKDEQEKFYNFKVGVAGLSIGSHAAATIPLMGGGRVLKLADPDNVSASNLNRMRYDFTVLGMSKCDLATQFAYQMNPYAEICAYPDGITNENIEDFFLKGGKIDILVEEMDNLELKIKIRLKAKELGIPVIMATDNGDNVIIDIERYDLDKNIEIFNGAAGHLTVEEFQKIPPQEIPRLATKLAGPNLVVPRMLDSLLEVGRTLYSWPQLGDAATLSGVVLAYLVKRIALGDKTATGKLEVNLDAIFDPEYFSDKIVSERDAHRKKFMQIIGLINK